MLKRRSDLTDDDDEERLASSAQQEKYQKWWSEYDRLCGSNEPRTIRRRQELLGLLRKSPSH